MPNERSVLTHTPTQKQYVIRRSKDAAGRTIVRNVAVADSFAEALSLVRELQKQRPGQHLYIKHIPVTHWE